MSRQATVTIICDLNPEDGEATPHVLTLDGKTVQIDLCAECLDPLTGYIEGGRPRGRMPREQAAEIREWAAQQGLMKPDAPGRIPARVLAKYEAEHGGAS